MLWHCLSLGLNWKLTFSCQACCQIFFFFASLFTWDRNLPYHPSPLSCDWISWCLSIQSSQYCQMRDITQEVFKLSTKGVLGLRTLGRTPDWPYFCHQTEDRSDLIRFINVSLLLKSIPSESLLGIVDRIPRKSSQLWRNSNCEDLLGVLIVLTSSEEDVS